MKTTTGYRMVIVAAVCALVVGAARGEVYLNHSGPWTTAGNWSSLPTSGTDWAKMGQGYSDGDSAPTVSIGPGDTVSGAQNLAVGRDLAGGITATINMSGGTLSGGHMYVGNNNSATGIVNQTGGSVTMSGNIQIGEGGCTGTYNLSNGGTVTAASLYAGNGGSGTLTLETDADSITVSGALYVSNGGGTGALTQHGGTITVQGGEFQVSRSGQGTYTMDGGTLNATALTTYIGNGAVGTFTQSGGTANFGTVNLGYSVASQYTLSGSGVLNVVTFNKNTGGSTFAFNGGTLSADTVNFDLANAGGTLAPGRTNSIGKTQVNGTYINGASATVQIQLAGTGQGTTYDWLSASGAVSLNGNLTVSLVNGFTPAGMDTFTVVTGSSVSGTFANAPVSGQRYNLGGGSFIVTYNANSVVLSVDAIIPAASMTASGAGGDGPASNVIDGNISTFSWGVNPVTLVLDGLYNLTGYTYLDRPGKAGGDPLTFNIDFIYDAYAAGGSTGYIPNTSVPSPQSGTLTGLAGMVLVKGDRYGGGAEVTLGGTKVANLLPTPSVVYGSSGTPYNSSYDWAYALDKNIATESAAAGSGNAYVVLDFGSVVNIAYVDFIDRESSNGGKWEFCNATDFVTILATVNYTNSSPVDSNVGDGFRPHVLDFSSLHVSARYVRWTAINGGNAGLREVTFYEGATEGNAVDNAGGETEVLATSAKIRGTLVSEAATPTTCKFYWWESGSATTNIVDMGTRAVGETFTNQLLGLSQNTTYYYKTYCTNSAGEQFALSAESFTTYGIPTVQNLAPTSVDSSSATVQGQLTGLNNGDAAIYWGLTDGGTNAANWGHTNSFPGQVPNVPFSVGLSSLTSFTNYYYRCYATNAYGAAWASATTNFFTQSATHDWRWSTPGGGDYRAGVNYNGGTQVAMPPTSADHVYIGISTYPAARYDNIVTINAPSYASYLTLGHDGTNNTLIVQSGGLTTAGQFDVGGGGNTFQQTGGNSVLTGGNTYTGNGGGSSSTSSFLLDGGSVKTLGYTLYIGYSYNSYLRIQSGATLDTSTAGTQSGGGGNLEINGGAAGATWDLEAGAVVYIGGSILVGHNGNGIVNQAGGMLTVNGNLAPAQGASGNLWTQNGGTNTVAGQFRLDASGVYALNGGVLSVNGGNSYLAVNGAGSVTLNQSGGTATFQTLDIGYTGNNGCAGVYNLSGGTLNADVLQKNSNGSSALNLTGSGVLSADTVQFNLSNASGTVAPGQAGTTGKTQVNGTYTNGASATVQIQLAGTGQGTTYDWLSASGAVTLDGNLIVSLVSFTPAGGDTFTVVTGSSVGGTFANAAVSGNRYNLGGGSFIVTYNAASVVLSSYQALGNAVDNAGETDVLATSAKIRGTLVSEAATPTTCKFYWWQSGSATTNIVDMGTRTVGETFTNQLLGLSQNTTYYYKTYCTNSAGEEFAGSAKSFTTHGIPTVLNLTPTSVDSSSATVQGQLTGLNNGDAAIYWGLTDGGTNAANWGHTNSFPGQVPNVPFSVGLSSLTTFTNYYYRCYATNAYGAAWASATTNFFTQSATHDWRWSTPGGGDYRAGTNYNGGTQVAMPPTSADHVYIGISTYPAARHDNVVTINAPSYASYLTLGSDGTNNTLIVQSGGLTTAGQFDIGGGGNTFQQTGGNSVLTGGNTYTGNGGGSSSTSSFLLDGGSVKTMGYVLYIGYSYNSYLRIQSGATLDTSTAGTQSGGGGSLEINGGAAGATWDLEAGAVVYIGGSIQVGQNGNGIVNQAGGMLTVNGNLAPAHGASGNLWTQNGGTNTVAGQFRLDASGVYALNGGVLSVNGGNSYLAVDGTGSATLNQSGGTATFQTLDIGYTGNNGCAGVYNLSGGTLNADVLQKNLNAGSALNLTGSGVLSADTVQFNLSNASGTVAPGQAGTRGKTQVNGTFANGASATVQIQLAGTGQGTTYDWLSASGAVTLDGNLVVSLVGFTPAGGDTFTVVTGSSVSGTFANAPVSGNRYNLGGCSFIVTYDATSVVLSDCQSTASGAVYSVR